MHDHHLYSMVQCLVEDGFLKEADLENAKTSIERHWEDKIAVVWSAEDVITQAKENGKVVNEEQAADVLQSILRHHDCSYGITWDTIDSNIDNLGELPKYEGEENE